MKYYALEVTNYIVGVNCGLSKMTLMYTNMFFKNLASWTKTSYDKCFISLTLHAVSYLI
jgi:hypothetical protein